MKFHSSTVQARYLSPLGPMLVAATDNGLAGVWFEGQRHLPDSSGWPHAPAHPVLAAAIEQLRDYFAGHGVSTGSPKRSSRRWAFPRRSSQPARPRPHRKPGNHGAAMP